MTKPIPPLSKFMTTTPMSVAKDMSLLEAAKLMQKEGIRHLPVTYDDKIEGILSTTDIQLIRGLAGVEIEKLKVYDCFTPNPVIMTPGAHLDQVLDEMAEKKIGCVIVADHEHLVGIFTWVDALKASSELMRSRLK